MFQNDDPVIHVISDCSEEGKKVTRNHGDKFVAVFRRIKDPYETAEVLQD